MKENYYIAYIQDNILHLGYVENICVCEKCKERGEAEIFLKNIDGSYLDCIKYKEGFSFCDELIYFGDNVAIAVNSIQKYYENQINAKVFDNKYLQSLIDLANKKLIG